MDDAGIPIGSVFEEQEVLLVDNDGDVGDVDSGEARADGLRMKIGTSFRDRLRRMGRGVA